MNSLTEIKVTVQERISKRQQRKSAATLRTLNISRSAERLSRCSDPTIYYYDLEQPRSGFQAIAAYGAILAMSNNDQFLSEFIVKKLAQRAYLQNYEGTWGLLQEFLEQAQDALQFERLASLHFTASEFYGNLLKAVALSMASIKPRRLTPDENAPVAKKERRRGYRDKGTLRSVESRARAAANTLLAVVEEFPRRTDRRHLVKHPLLHKEATTDLEVSSLVTLSALEELHEAAELYLKKGGTKNGNLLKPSDGSVRRIQEILIAFINELKGRIEANQPPDLRTQSEESRAGNGTS